MRKLWVYLGCGLLFGTLGFLVADTGQAEAAAIGFGLGLLVVFFVQVFPSTRLPEDELDSLDQFDALDRLDERDKGR